MVVVGNVGDTLRDDGAGCVCPARDIKPGAIVPGNMLDKESKNLF